jgi:hypothetical protein
MSELTTGQKMCGVGFNPGGDETVAKIKQAFADLTDAVLESGRNVSPQQAKMFDKVIDDIMTAQMWAVKSLTWKP